MELAVASGIMVLLDGMIPINRFLVGGGDRRIYVA